MRKDPSESRVGDLTCVCPLWCALQYGMQDLCTQCNQRNLLPSKSYPTKFWFLETLPIIWQYFFYPDNIISWIFAKKSSNKARLNNQAAGDFGIFSMCVQQAPLCKHVEEQEIEHPAQNWLQKVWHGRVLYIYGQQSYESRLLLSRKKLVSNIWNSILL